MATHHERSARLLFDRLAIDTALAPSGRSSARPVPRAGPRSPRARPAKPGTCRGSIQARPAAAVRPDHRRLIGPGQPRVVDDSSAERAQPEATRADREPRRARARAHDERDLLPHAHSPGSPPAACVLPDWSRDACQTSGSSTPRMSTRSVIQPGLNSISSSGGKAAHARSSRAGIPDEHGDPETNTLAPDQARRLGRRPAKDELRHRTRRPAWNTSWSDPARFSSRSPDDPPPGFLDAFRDDVTPVQDHRRRTTRPGRIQRPDRRDRPDPLTRHASMRQESNLRRRLELAAQASRLTRRAPARRLDAKPANRRPQNLDQLQTRIELDLERLRIARIELEHATRSTSSPALRSDQSSRADRSASPPKPRDPTRPAKPPCIGIEQLELDSPRLGLDFPRGRSARLRLQRAPPPPDAHRRYPILAAARARGPSSLRREAPDACSAPAPVSEPVAPTQDGPPACG